MKKRILLLVVALMMCMSTVAFAAASNGANLDAEEKAVGNLLTALDKGNFVAADFIPGWNTEKFTGISKDVKTQFGSKTESFVVSWAKFSDSVDIVRFGSKYTNAENVLIEVRFDVTGKKPVIIDFAMSELKPAPAPTTEAAE